jgi:hypothetical protein
LKNACREEDDGESDFDTNAIGNADFRSIAKEGEEPRDEAADSIEFIETPIPCTAGDIPVEDRRSEDDEETEEEDIGRCFERGSPEMGEQGEKEEEGEEEEEEGMGEFEEEIEKRARRESSDGVLDKESE